jgi:Prokaryotic E2 family E
VTSLVTITILPSEDQAYIERVAPGATIEVESGMTCVVAPEFALPAGFTVAAADLLIRLGPSYPDVAPDMWWFSPAVVRADGAPIAATEVTETVLGRSWQRWSRHFTPGSWLTGTDTLESYVALVASELTKAAA